MEIVLMPGESYGFILDDAKSYAKSETPYTSGVAD